MYKYIYTYIYIYIQTCVYIYVIVHIFIHMYIDTNQYVYIIYQGHRFISKCQFAIPSVHVSGGQRHTAKGQRTSPVLLSEPQRLPQKVILLFFWQNPALIPAIYPSSHPCFLLFTMFAWKFSFFTCKCQLEVSRNKDAPNSQSSILMGCSLINHSFGGTSIYGNPQFLLVESPLKQKKKIQWSSVPVRRLSRRMVRNRPRPEPGDK